MDRTTLIDGEDVIGEIRELMGRDGDGDIQVMGSASLAHQLVART